MKEQLVMALRKLAIEDIREVISQSSDPKELILSLTADEIHSFEMAIINNGCNKEILSFDGWGNNRKGLGSYDSKNMFFESYAFKKIPTGEIYEEIIAILRKPFMEESQDTTPMQQAFNILDDKRFPEYSIHTQSDDLGCWLKRILPILGIRPSSGTAHSAVCFPKEGIDLATLTQIVSSLERTHTHKQNQISDLSQRLV